jgi:hypothetical protein
MLRRRPSATLIVNANSIREVAAAAVDILASGDVHIKGAQVQIEQSAP